MKLIDTFILISVISGIVFSVITPSQRFGRYIRFSVGLLLCSLTVGCIYGLIGDFKKNFERLFTFEFNYDYEEQSYNDLIVKSTDENIRESISQIAKQKFKLILMPEDIIVQYDTSDITNVVITSIVLNDDNVFAVNNLYELADYIGEMFMCECKLG